MCTQWCRLGNQVLALQLFICSAFMFHVLDSHKKSLDLLAIDNSTEVGVSRGNEAIFLENQRCTRLASKEANADCLYYLSMQLSEAKAKYKSVIRYVFIDISVTILEFCNRICVWPLYRLSWSNAGECDKHEHHVCLLSDSFL